MLGVTCPQGDPSPPIAELTVTNNSAAVVHIKAVRSPDPFMILDPGQTGRSMDAPNTDGECTETTLVAETEGGDVVDRRPSPFCEGETWVIRAD